MMSAILRFLRRLSSQILFGTDAIAPGLFVVKSLDEKIIFSDGGKPKSGFERGFFESYTLSGQRISIREKFVKYPSVLNAARCGSL